MIQNRKAVLASDVSVKDEIINSIGGAEVIIFLELVLVLEKKE